MSRYLANDTSAVHTDTELNRIVQAIKLLQVSSVESEHSRLRISLEKVEAYSQWDIYNSAGTIEMNLVDCALRERQQIYHIGETPGEFFQVE